MALAQNVQRGSMTDVALGATGVGAGAASTLAIRRQFDATGETSVLRPSVLWGGATGLGALAAPMLWRDLHGTGAGMFLEDYGLAAVTAAVFSMFNPKGSGVQLPTV